MSAPASGSPLPTLSDRYRVEREVGRGGMATIYLAQDLKHQRSVAIKVIRPQIAAGLGRELFLREIEFAARLDHPHLVPLFDSGSAGDLLYYVMPYVAGETLRAHLTREPRLPLAEALRWTREIASALGYAHRQGLIHRDVKPENVLVSDGLARVTDFGVARAVSSAAADGVTRMPTGPGAAIGTPTYMSPEQAAGGEVDAASDLYALGCVLYEMLAGRPPFVAPTASEILRMHLVDVPASVSELRPDVPEAVSAVVAKALAKSPSERFGSAARFIEALEAAAAGAFAPSSARAAAPATPAAQHNLPQPRTRFVGRESELAACVRLLEEARLLTLTGSGGAGTTRLARRVAEQLLGHFPDGVRFVDLAPLPDGSRVAEATAAALGVREAPGTPLESTLTAAVRDKRVLLVLDNCEHVLAACASLADALLEGGETVRILATSREGLGVEGERVFALRSLPVPSPEASHDLAAVAASDAVALFVDRARAVAGEFVLDARNARIVAEICRRLDGIPLAIELAAARAKLLSPGQILSKLDDRFRLLTGGKSALPRHQTLRATIQWSYDQLAAEEQRLLAALSVFAGGWSLEAAARVTAEDGDEFATLDALSRLVDKSLVQVERSRADPRYELLETVRQYGLERLLEQGLADAMRARHLAFFLERAERAYAKRLTNEDEWSSALERDHGNLRAAADYARATNAETHLALAGALTWFWLGRSHLGEGLEHITAALASTEPLPLRAARARATWGASVLRMWQGDASAAFPFMEEALAQWRALGDTTEVALALEGLGWVHFLANDEERALVSFEESLVMQREVGDPVLVHRAMVAVAQAYVALSRVEEARALAERIVEFARGRSDPRSEHFGWHFLADCALLEGRCEESLGLYWRSLELAESIGDRLEISFEVQGVAMSLAGLGRREDALLLHAAARAEWERLGIGIRVRFWEVLVERYIGGARRELGDEAAARIEAEGARLSFDAAVSRARETRT